MKEVLLKMQYIGACALLGRISGSRLTEDENDCIAQALADCTNLYPDSFTVWETSGGGYSLETKI